DITRAKPVPQNSGGASLSRFGCRPMSIRPPHVSPNQHPIRRKVALAYRSTREAGGSHRDALAFAMTAYFDERPDEYSNPTAASDRVAAMISSAVSVDPEWFWQDYWRKR